MSVLVFQAGTTGGQGPLNRGGCTKGTDLFESWQVPINPSHLIATAAVLESGLITRSAAFVGIGKLTATAVRLRQATASFIGKGVLAGTPRVIHLRTAAFVGRGVLSATPVKISGTPTATVPGPGIRRRRRRLPAMTSAVAQLAEDLQVWDRWEAEDADLIDLVLTGVL